MKILKDIYQKVTTKSSSEMTIKPVVTKASLEKRIDKNRDEIHRWLNGNYPLNLVYMRTRMLSAQNERLIAQLKEI